MNLKKTLPVLLLAGFLVSGCDMDRYIYKPPHSEYSQKHSPETIKSSKYVPCYIYTSSGIKLRGAPATSLAGRGLQAPAPGKTRVAVFPAPKVPRIKHGRMTPQGLYSGLTNEDPQVRSDTLYAIDQILSDPSKDESRPQIQAMLDDYLKKLARKKSTDYPEYETVKTIYDQHLSDETTERPNWKGFPDDTGKEKEVSVLPEKKLSLDNHQPSGITYPDFDFSDPASEGYDEPSEIEKHMVVNEKMADQKKVEDAVVDAELVKVAPKDPDLWKWSCDQNACATRLKGNSSRIEELLTEAKYTLADKTQNVSSRLYAICTMKCISQADKKFEPDVVEYLSLYIRRRTPWIIPAKGQKEPPIKAVRPDVQAALFVVAARDRMKELGYEINLLGTDLRGADLSFANLYNTNLSFSNLSSSNLERAYGLLDWNKVYLATIDTATRIPESISAGFIVTRKPQLPPQPVGSYTVTTDDWIFWKAVPVTKP